MVLPPVGRIRDKFPGLSNKAAFLLSSQILSTLMLRICSRIRTVRTIQVRHRLKELLLLLLLVVLRQGIRIPGIPRYRLPTRRYRISSAKSAAKSAGSGESSGELW
ncbi:MAG: hypothetical protein OXC07_13100, partial [Kistimonas sp.]|nr:hypothetical protein [Kistimonas sp.]